MIKKIPQLFSMFLVFNSFMIYSQNFVKLNNEFGHESIRSISQLDSSSVLLLSTGQFEENSSYFKLISRSFDTESMKIKWKNYYTHQHPFNVQSNGVVKNDVGNSIITGVTSHANALGENNCFVSEMDSKGNVLWAKNFGEEPDNDWGVGITQLEDKGYAIAGWKYKDPNSIIMNALVRKISSSGDSIWTKYFPVDTSTIYGKTKGVAVVGYDFNSLYFVYHKHSEGYSKQIFTIVKMDGSTGSIYWEKDYDIGQTSTVYGVEKTDEGNIRIEGLIRWVNEGGCVTPAVWEINIDGDIVLQKDYMDDLGCTFGDKFSKTNDGGFAFTINDGSYPKLVKLDRNYDFQWAKTYKIEQYMSPTGVVQMPNGNYIIAGYEGATSDYTIWIIKTNERGDLVTATSIIDDVDVRVYPNPTPNSISIDSKFKKLKYKLFDVHGKLVQESILLQKVDMSRLPTGLYFIHLFKEDGELIKIEKIVKINSSEQ